MEIVFLNRQEEISLPEKMEKMLRKIINLMGEEEGIEDSTEVSLVVVDDQAISELNSRYLGREGPTDVLSFGADDGEEEKLFEEKSLGDIVVSAPRAVQQAREYGHSLEREMAYLSVHGMLHLLGYDHQTQEQKEIMRQKEEEVLEKADLPRA